MYKYILVFLKYILLRSVASPLLSGVYNAWYTLPAVEQGLNLARSIPASPPLLLPLAFDDTSLRFRWVGTTCAQVKVLGSAEYDVALVSRPHCSLSLRPATISFSVAFLARTTFPITCAILRVWHVYADVYRMAQDSMRLYLVKLFREIEYK